jgi:hypothetical protein
VGVHSNIQVLEKKDNPVVTDTLATTSRPTPATEADIPSGVLDWLLDPNRPAVRRLTLVRLLDRPIDDPDVVELNTGLASDPWVAPLLAGAWRAGHENGTRVHPYSKWTGAHWRLVSLAELGVTIETPGAAAEIREASEATLAWLLSPGRARRTSRPVNGRVRICASQEGNALWSMTRLGLGSDERATVLAEHLIDWQWPDGGWNCDKRPAASHSSMNESWVPIRAFAAYRPLAPMALRSPVDEALERGIDFLFRHRLLWSERTGELMNLRVGLLRWPPYWRYGLLPALLTVQEAGRLKAPEARDALDELESRRLPDERWRAEGRWWTSPGQGSAPELVDWGEDGESRMLTLHALDILRGSGRRNMGTRWT